MHNNDTQRTDDWRADRLGIPTASRFKDIMTDPKTKADKEAGVLSQTAQSYALELIAERLTGLSKDFSSAATDWGNQYESVAVEAYKAHTGQDVLECGFVRHATLETGASPDGLIGLDGGIEIKCPFNTVNHLNNALSGEVPKEYYSQVQGQMWICNLDWVDFVSFDPRIDGPAGLVVIRCNRDQDYINQLEQRIINFNDYITNTLAKLEGF